MKRVLVLLLIALVLTLIRDPAAGVGGRRA